ncbi:hypothetical protein [Sporomusa sp. GT1]|uniref:hypothetical protein n=1 Tax=Sporomusa sp. GT1 TaxID=1534747 RepID=UPI00166CB4E2|nr:hypothetical protein [Sporomusa sp. GT1]
MGEKLKDLGSIKIKGTEFIIELNEPTAKGLQRDIHIQNEFFRLELKEKDFFDMACVILAAKKQLDNLKRK